MADDAYDRLDAMVGAALVQESAPRPQYIRELIGKLRTSGVCGEVSDEDAERLARRIEHRLGVTMSVGAVLTDKKWEPWLQSVQADIDPYYWSRYRKLLQQYRFSGPVVSTINNVTDRILGLLENPATEGPWDRRGMVVGHVQSGKTANYTGLMCKAADAGYKLIVVIAGIHNNLRNQTQLRIDEGFVGRDSAHLLSQKGERFVGVGKFDNLRRPVTFTNSLRDFNKATATAVAIPLDNLTEPAVLVIKKNTHTLRNLVEWLQEHSGKGITNTIAAPMLLIDDEADNASINIRHGKSGVSTINGLIRDLLNSFDRSCYIGYTATPFANIFIDPDTEDEMRGEDLFPKNFIVSLDPPSNYFGASRVLLEEPEKIVRSIDDNADLLPVKHPIDLQLAGIPESLEFATRSFVLARAIRLTRGHDRQHCSMLVNASRFKNVQRQLRNAIHATLEGIQVSVRVHGKQPLYQALKDPEIAALREVWSKEYRESAAWSDVQAVLHEAAAPIQVVEVNSNSSGTLNYKDNEKHGLSVIAVGGYSLSRGLTLEGLMVSYFLRNSMMYDTLMQMGRWFGYRPEYEDLCRVWMSEEAEGWYTHVAESIELLRDELKAMEAAGATPEDFGLKVRSHPDTLIVTARNKMGSGELVVVRIGLGNSFVETAILKRDEGTLVANRAAAISLAAALREGGYGLENAKPVSGGFFLKKVPVTPILQFLSEFQNHEGSLLTYGDPVRRYIIDRPSELGEWDVLFASTSRAEALTDNSLGRVIRCQQRVAGDRSNSSTLHVTNKQRVASRGVEKTGLTGDQIKAAKQRYRLLRESEGRRPSEDEKTNYPDWVYRYERKRPLLIVHLLEVTPKKGGTIDHSQPVVAFSLSFPKTDTEEKRVEYVVNTTWLREHFADEADEEEMEGDA